MLWLVTSVLPSAVVTISFMPPEAEQISCVACGLTMGDAIATPNDNTKPSNTQRAKEVARRKVWSRELFNIAKLSLMTSFQIVKASF
jgi:ribosome biogenesis SPOUT family RNA methylase Rps3